jgi:hypothetical protein
MDVLEPLKDALIQADHPLVFRRGHNKTLIPGNRGNNFCISCNFEHYPAWRT